jgi:hypothetical protein
MISAGPSIARNACGVMVANSAASPVSTAISRSPSDRPTRPSSTKNQSCPGCTRCCAVLRVGSSRILTAIVEPVGRLSSQVVRLPELLGVGRMTTSSSLRTSRSASRSTWSAAASGSRMSRLIVRLPVSTRLIVDGLRFVRAASSSSDRPNVVRRLRSRVRTVRSISFCVAIDSGLPSCEYRKSPCGSSLVTISSKP